MGIIYASKICPTCSSTSTTTTSTTSTTTSTTTTTTTTTLVGISVFNDGDVSITGIRSNGVAVSGITLPIGPGDNSSGFIAFSASTTIAIDITVSDTNTSIALVDALFNSFCQNTTTTGTYTFPGINATNTVTINENFDPCP